MNPTEIIELAAEEGVVLALMPSGSISAKGEESVIGRWLPTIQESKAEIVALLRPGTDGWSAEDWLVFFDERAAIVEFDGGVPRPEAEAQAFACCISEWMNRHPTTSSPDCCLACGSSDSANDPLLPYGTETHGYAWLHSRCWKGWYDARKEEAIVALTAMGIETPAKFPNDFGKNGST